MRGLSARDIALRAMRGSLQRHMVFEATTRKGSSSSSGSALPPPQLPPPIEPPPPLEKRRFGTGDRNDRCNRRTTGRVKEAQGASRNASQAADGSSSSSSESSTDTEMGLVDVCTILCGNSERATGKPVAVAEEREGGNSERATRKPVAVAEEREGGPVTLDLTKLDSNKAACRTSWNN